MNGRRNYFKINLHESIGTPGIKLKTPGPAVGLATDCAKVPGEHQ